MPLIMYEEMDLDNPPRGINLKVCPNCKRPAELRYGRDGWRIYVHTAWSTRRRRHYCKMSKDGNDLEMVMPTLPAEEKSCGST